MLARKISRAKWEPIGYLAENEIRADAISGGCLRTSGDTLSWWRCSGDEDDVAEVALALATGPNKTNFDKIDVVVLPEEELAVAGLTTKPEAGDTLIKDLKSRHVNVVRLDVERLAMIARILALRIRTGKNVFTFTRGKLKTLVSTAIKAERVNRNDLDEKLQEELDKSTGGPGS